jgi:hypothetical protein
MEEEMQSVTQQAEISVATKDGELAKCEKLLSEVRAMLSEKTMHQNRLEGNLSNEVTVMSDRIQNMEQERNVMIDKYTRYGEEFKQLLNTE